MRDEMKRRQLSRTTCSSSAYRDLSQCIAWLFCQHPAEFPQTVVAVGYASPSATLPLAVKARPAPLLWIRGIDVLVAADRRAAVKRQ